MCYPVRYIKRKKGKNPRIRRYEEEIPNEPKNLTAEQKESNNYLQKLLERRSKERSNLCLTFFRANRKPGIVGEQTDKFGGWEH